MQYLLDTDTIIYFLNGERNIVNKMASIDVVKLYTTTISQAELIYGAYNSKNSKSNIDIVKRFLSSLEILLFDEEAAHEYGKIKASLRKKGELIEDMDLCISSIAIANDMMLITNNTKHFKRVPHLKIENWRE